jgi:hypothetical protein
MLYGALTGITALRIGWTLRSLPAVPTAGGLILVVHLCYGAGLFMGVIMRSAGRTHQQAPAEWHGLASHGDTPSRAAAIAQA